MSSSRRLDPVLGRRQDRENPEVTKEHGWTKGNQLDGPSAAVIKGSSGLQYPHHHYLPHFTSPRGLIVLMLHTQTPSQEAAAWVRPSIHRDTETPHVGRWLSAREDSGTARVWQPPIPLPQLSSKLLFTIFIFPAVQSHKAQDEVTKPSH